MVYMKLCTNSQHAYCNITDDNKCCMECDKLTTCSWTCESVDNNKICKNIKEAL